MKRLVATAALALACAVSNVGFASAQIGDSIYIGELRLFAYNWCPLGWESAEGQVLNIAANQALFSLLGTNFGGDGKTTFALPKPNLTTPKDMTWCIATVGVYPPHN
jgi:microcystin-dependent protein